MKNDCFLIVLPNMEANDLVATVVDWIVDEGKFVNSGDIICSVETTKATYDIESEYSGYLAQLVQVGKEQNVSSPLALVAQSPQKAVTKSRNIYIIKIQLLKMC